MVYVVEAKNKGMRYPIILDEYRTKAEAEAAIERHKKKTPKSVKYYGNYRTRYTALKMTR